MLKVIFQNVYIDFLKTNAQKYRFIGKYNDFTFKNNKLIFKLLMLEVIPNNKEIKHYQTLKKI